MKIIFLGTPDFAVPSLEILYNAGYDIVGVITSVDKYGGRGRKTLIESAVKKYARSKGLNILQPTNLKSPKFNAKLKALDADIQIVVAFRMLPVMVWDMPPLGTYNLHGSLLPKYRGAAPINWAIINGDTKTGVTSFKLKHEIDTGSILFQKEIPIYESDSAGDLHDRMMWIAADTILESVQSIEKKEARLIPQEDSLVSHAPKLNKENTFIDFNKSAQEVYNLVRGLYPYPTAWFKLDGKSTKIKVGRPIIIKHNHKAGTVLSDNKSRILICTLDGYYEVEELQMSGKKSMKTKELLNGYTIKEAKSIDLD